MRGYKVRLREWGLIVKRWNKIPASSATGAINQVCPDGGKPYQEWVASKEDFSKSVHCQLRLSDVL